MSYIIAFLPYILQLSLIIHIIKNRKPFLWLWLIVFLPYIGGLVYLLLEVLPELLSSNSVRNLGQAIDHAVNPSKKILELEGLVKRQETIANKTLLADAYYDDNRFEEALTLYQSCLTGPYSQDEELLFKKIKVLLALDKRDEAKEELKAFKQKYELKNSEQVLLDLNLNEDFEKIQDIFFNSNNFQAGYYCAKHFQQLGESEKVETVINEMEDNLKQYKYLKKTDNYIWYKKAKGLVHN